jgi:type IV pilus assembly protein PilV
MNMTQRFTPKGLSGPMRTERGAGLIEVLVAVLILALGLLGMAGLQANALKKNQSSYARGQAVMMSYYILDAMRADRPNALSGNYDTASTGLCSSAAITGTTLADNTRKNWVDSLRDNLGDADTTCGIIDCDNAGVCTITIQWNDELAGGLGAQSFVTRSRL